MRRAFLPKSTLSPLAALLPLAIAIAAAPVSCGLDVQGVDYVEEGSGGRDATSASTGISTTASSSSGSGTSTTSSSTTGSGAGGSTSSGAGGAVAMPENCLDGVDNDLDGHTDCDDDECSPDFECIPAAPDGWSYARAVKTPFKANPDPCDDQTGPDVYYRNPDAGSCTGCSCQANVTQCKPAELTCFIGSSGNNCNSAKSFTVGPADDNACSPPGASGQNGDKFGCLISANSKLPANAACTGPASALVNTDPFGGEMHACDIPKTGGGCMANQVCAPKATKDSTYLSACIVKSGSDNETCMGEYSAKVAAYSGFDDKRSCSACDCSNVLSCAPTGQLTVWDGGDCTNAGSGNVNFDTLNQCKDVSVMFDGGSGSAGFKSHNTPNVMKTGTCSGGDSAGPVTTQGPATFCCKP